MKEDRFYVFNAEINDWLPNTLTIKEIIETFPKNSNPTLQKLGDYGYAEDKPIRLFDYIEENDLTEYKPLITTIQTKQGKKLEKMNNFPAEIRAAAYVLSNKEMKLLINKATSFFDTASSLLKLILVVNIIAITICGIALIFSLGS